MTFKKSPITRFAPYQIGSILFLLMLGGANDFSHLSSASLSTGLALTVYAPGSMSVTEPTMQRYMVYPTDMLDYQTSYNSKFPTILHAGGGPSLAAVQNATILARQNLDQIIGYDFEHWTKTPAVEQANPVASVDKAASIVHNAGTGLKFLFDPDGAYLYTHPCNPQKAVPVYESYHWKNIDYLLIQFQASGYAGCDGTGTNVAAFVSNIQKVVSYAKNQNPNLVVFEQLSFKWDSPTTLIAKTAAISNVVQGVSYYFNANQTICSQCTLANLQLVLGNLRPNL